MFVTPDGKKIFVIDGHTHLWDARPENRRNRYGLTFIEVFWNGHNGLTPPAERWPWERFLHYGVENAAKDLFVDGYCDMAIMLPTYLFEFYKQGFNTTAQCAAIKEAYPEKIILAGRMDPRDGEKGLDRLEADHARWKFTSVKIYTAEWAGASKGYSLKEDSVHTYLEKCRKLGIDIIHIHKGPTIHPLNMDAFDVHDVDDVATAFPDLKFVIDHCGIPRIDDFCWIANQEPNVYGGLSVVTAFIHMRPKYFASMMADLLWFLGPDRLIFGTDYGIYSPKWIVEEFMRFEFDEATAREAGTELTLDVKAKILGLNAARLYGIRVPAECHYAPPAELVVPPSDRAAEVRAALAGVTDPELDESIVDLGFLSRVEVDGDRAEVDFRLPTFWCSANFAWIMAEDMRAALAALPWLCRADIRLVDHFAAERINAGIAAGRGFRQAFDGEAAGDLAELHETFRRKAFLGRMARVIEALRECGLGDDAIVGLSISDLGTMRDRDATSPAAAIVGRYLELRGSFGGPAGPADPAFRTIDGATIAPDDLAAWLRDIRMTRRGVEANGEMCRILLKARYGDRQPGQAG